MVGGMGAEAGYWSGERGGGGRERSRVKRAVILASHFQLALLEMEQRSGSSRERREREKERVQRDLAGRGEVPSKRRRVVPSSANLLREFTNSRGRTGERTSELGNPGERTRRFLLRELFFASPCRRCSRKSSLSISKKHVD